MSEEFKKFAFETPLYSDLPLPSDFNLAAILLGCVGCRVDGHCPYCGQTSTFFVQKKISKYDSYGGTWDEKLEYNAVVKFHFREMICARDPDHQIRYWFRIHHSDGDEYFLTKTGQFPSLADVANDEARSYREILSKEDSSELHKAIGLAAHGVGIGSFVYLRRIFERLVNGRFNEFKESENWDYQEFRSLRMDQKVELLREHIPPFLYDNRRLYSVLSKGIHELSDELCLQAFEPIKLSIKIVLEEDKKKQEELELRSKAAAAIASFQS
ncbi:hypothetical protein [Amaricoccus tamworthensis]|uniref:hypothetical protein n=1 Tax=Amaricoccus tamworthensis TaxID=57002 RepID=UPI003C7E54E0